MPRDAGANRILRTPPVPCITFPASGFSIKGRPLEAPQVVVIQSQPSEFRNEMRSLKLKVSTQNILSYNVR